VLSSFKHDASTAASVLNKSLDDASRRELLKALGRTKEPPPTLDRCCSLCSAAI
jgi:hypothetical protein